MDSNDPAILSWLAGLESPQQFPKRKTPTNPAPSILSVSTGFSVSSSSAPSVQTGSGSLSDKTGCAEADYHIVLNDNRIAIEDLQYEVPTCVGQRIKSILERVPGSHDSAISHDEARRRSIALYNADLRSKATIRYERAIELFPHSIDISLRSDGMPFRDQCVRSPPDGWVLPIVTPKPDVVYGYGKECDPDLQLAQSTNFRGRDLSGLFSTNNHQFRSYLAAELESDSEATARHKCAGIGATCSHVAALLYNIAEECSVESFPHNDVSSLAFTTTITGCHADLYAHCIDDVPHSGWSRMFLVDSCPLTKPEEYAKFYTSIRNIIHWGLDERYEYQNKLLRIISRQINLDFYKS